MTSRPTIFARSTGALPSAIAIVRISGPSAQTALTRLSTASIPSPRMAVVRRLRHPTTDAPLDTALVLWLPGPDTVTGEDIVELHLHGGWAVVMAVERALALLPGFQPAEPGAFTRRAFENGRLDLTQVEGLADLLAAETERQRVAALVQAEGGLRREVERWQARLLQLAARAEALIDFADEDDVGRDDDSLRQDCIALGATLEEALANPPTERLRDGVRIAIAGPPNVGKSTLINALTGREAAIASPIAGTTRDLIEAPVNIDGMAVIFVDMAGLRADSDDPVEAIGISRAEGAILRSDLVLWLGDPLLAPPGDHVVVVATKSDLGTNRYRAELAVSALTGENMLALRSLIVERVTKLLPGIGRVALSIAQQDHVRAAAIALAHSALSSDEVLVAEDIRAALRALDRITGTADTEAMLDNLFGKFCIGK